ncbi:MAG: protein kinase, partial [Polyangia bacterium]|nr:protein kinase [Polyangia bacterium]
MERLGKNELISKIGQGGMAEVYLARASLALGLQKLVVVKKIHAAFSRSPHFARMFRTEASMATQLNHPNIVQVFDFGKEGDEHYLVMEYVEGFDLMRLVKLSAQAGRRIPQGLGVYIVQELLKGLDYAHRKTGPTGEPLEIVHRDVSPQNVLISMDGAVKLVDFGIAKTRTEVEEEGVVKGKYAYMSPEQASGQPVDRRCDVFASGIILYELVTGRTLFAGLKGEEALKAVRTATIPPPSSVDPQVPKALEPIVMRALARRLDDRYSTARDFQHDLTRYLYSLEEIYDTAALAGFIHQIMPDEAEVARAAAPRQLTAVAPSSGTSSALGLEDSELRGRPGSGSSPMTERKKVLLVCGQFSPPGGDGTSLEDKLRTQAVARFTAVAEDIVFKYEAVVDTTTPERITALVGLPVATEEDAGRAIHLARALEDAFGATCEDFGAAASLSLSIVRGFTVVERQPDGRFKYQIGQSLLHLGQLLVTRAQPGEILVDDHVAKAGAEEWLFEEVPLLSEELRQVREEGSSTSEPGTVSMAARVFKVAGPGAGPGAPLGQQTFVGRVLEMKALQDTFLDMQRQRAGRVLVVYGDKGMGKRALVRVFLERLSSWQGQVVRMVARQADQMAVHGTLSEVALQLISPGETLPSADLRKRIREIAALMEEELRSDLERDFVTPLEVLLGLAEEASLVHRDPGELNQEIQEALYRLLRWRSGHSPLVLVLVNAHLTSQVTLGQLAELAQRLEDRPILAILTSQPLRDRDELLPGVKGLAIHLGELGPDERRELALTRFVDHEEAEPLVRQVLERAGGNPYYIEAILDSLVEQGICVRDDKDPLSRMRPTRQDAQVQLPATVESLVASRLDRLQPSLRDLLRKAAVLGRVFEGSHLQRLHGESVSEGLAALEERHLVYPMTGFADRWSFNQV